MRALLASRVIRLQVNADARYHNAAYHYWGPRVTRDRECIEHEPLIAATPGRQFAQPGSYSFTKDARGYADSWLGPEYVFCAGYQPATPGPSNPIVSVQFYVGVANIHARPGDLVGWTNVITACDVANSMKNDAFMLQMIERDADGKAFATIVGGQAPTTFGVDKIRLRFARAPIPLRLAEAVQHLATELCRIVANDPCALDHIEWRDLERLIAAALRDIGFTILLTRPSKDGGKDIVARCQVVNESHTFYIEVKHWRKKRVGEQDIKSFVKVNVADGTQGGLFLSTSDYSGAVYQHRAEITRDLVHLGNRQTVVALARHAIRSRDGLWLGSNLPEILFQECI
ncbi:MAG: type restriction endonuclease [Gemmatimonadetes bacterium]|nr:type restriction endonuclease [Gemmatimonadota bacterium]